MKRLPKWLLRVGLLLAIGIGGAIVWLDVRGFPRCLVALVAQQFARAGYAFECGRMRLDWLRGGVITTEMRLADARTPDQTLATIDEVVLHISLRRLWRKQNAVTTLRVINANLRVPTPADEIGGEQFSAEHVYARMEFEDDGTIVVRHLYGTYCGVKLNVSGRLKPQAATTAIGVPKAPRGPVAPGSGRFAFVTKILRELHGLRAAHPPQLDLQFDVDLARPMAGQMQLRLYGDDLQYREVAVDRLFADVRMRDGAIDLQEGFLKAGDGELVITGRYDVARGEFDLRLHSTVHPRVIATALPDKVASAVNQVRVGPRPLIEAHYQLTPHTGSRPLLRGRVDITDLGYQGVLFQRVSAEVEQQGAEIFVRDARVVMAEGELTGSGQYHIESSDFEYQFVSTLDPTKLLPMMMPGIKCIVEPSAFTKGPYIRAHVVGDFVDPEAFAYEAEVIAEKCSYRGVLLTGAKAQLRLKRNQLSVTELVVNRPEGKLTGTVDVDFNANRVAFDVTTTADPVALAPLLGPRAAQVMEPYRFGSKLCIRGQGVADFEEPTRTVWSISGTSNDFQFGDWRAGQATAEVRYTNAALQAALDLRDLCRPRLKAAAANATIEVRGAEISGAGTVTNLVWQEAQAGVLQGSVRGTGQRYQAEGWAAPIVWGGATASVGRATLTIDGARVTGTGELTNVTWKTLRAEILKGDLDVTDAAFRMQAAATGFAWWKLRTDKATAAVTFTNDTLRITNFDGTLYSGKLGGGATFVFGEKNTYALQINVTDCDMDQLTRSLREAPDQTITGTLTGGTELQGSGNDLETMTGNGWFYIKDGVLWESAVFGIFSHILGKTRATDAQASFVVTDQKVRTEDLKVAAGVFTATSQGAIDFDGRLDFRVQAHFLRAWPGINWITGVIGKVLEYKVGGTLDKPTYRPVNLPKELLPHK